MSGSGTIRQTVVRVGVELVNKGVQFFFLIFVARLLGATDFGAYTFALAWATVFTLFTELGLHTIATREIAADREKRASHIFGNALVAKAFLDDRCRRGLFPPPTVCMLSSVGRLLWLLSRLVSFTDLAYALLRHGPCARRTGLH